MTTALALGESSAQPSNDLKRKRSGEEERSEAPHAVQKTQRTANSHLAINYLARQFDQDLPLLSTDDALPAILHLLNDYHGVLERHESMACNLGARPLGPILIKRFERLFDEPPKILKNHGKDGNVVTWLDVVEFARSKPEQFLLGQMSEGVRVCQIYAKGCRVQISEEDYMLISSGIPQKMIPPQPIVEDEEKELVAARARQLKHRINGRRQAILERRANEPGPVIRGTSPSVLNGSGMVPSSHSPYGDTNGRPAEYSKTGASAATRAELMSKFLTIAEKDRRDSERQLPVNEDPRSFSIPAASHNGRPTARSLPLQQEGPVFNGHEAYPHESTSRVSSSYQNRFTQSPSTNAYGDNFSVHSFTVPPPAAAAGVIKEVKADNDGPFRAEMVARMETLKKGDRVLPPCDRCRRLHMDCIKNLTACVGCTKKHARCSWRDVRESELWGPEKGKVPIPPHSGVDTGSEDNEREASVGLRPDHASVQLLQALSEHNHGHAAGPSEDYSVERTLALEGLAVSSTGNGEFSNHHPANNSRFQSPSTPHAVHSVGVISHTGPSVHSIPNPFEPLRFESAPVASMRPESSNE